MLPFQTLHDFIQNPFGITNEKKSDEYEKKYQAMKKKSNFKIEGYTSIDQYKMDFADPQKYFAEGYNAGANFAEDPMRAIKGALGLGSDPAIQEMLNNQQKQLGATEQIANNTAAKGEDDYKYLKEVMGGRAVDRLSGTDIKIDMTNNNAINSALDLDVIVDTLTSKLTAAMDSAGEGVHV